MSDTRTPPKLATTLLKHLGPSNDALAGDLREAYEAGKSRRWYRGQVITIIAMNVRTPGRHRAIWSSVAATAGITVVLELPSAGWIAGAHSGSAVPPMLYLIPSALPIAVPVGITVGMFSGFGQGEIRLRPLPLLVLAAILCVASLVTNAWVVPASNQAYRVTIAGPRVLRGANELTLPALRTLVVDNAVPPTGLIGTTDRRRRRQ